MKPGIEGIESPLCIHCQDYGHRAIVTEWGTFTRVTCSLYAKRWKDPIDGEVLVEGVVSAQDERRNKKGCGPNGRCFRPIHPKDLPFWRKVGMILRHLGVIPW